MYTLITIKNGYFYKFRNNNLELLKSQAHQPQWQGARITDRADHELYTVGL